MLTSHEDKELERIVMNHMIKKNGLDRLMVEGKIYRGFVQVRVFHCIPPPHARVQAE